MVARGGAVVDEPEKVEATLGAVDGAEVAAAAVEDGDVARQAGVEDGEQFFDVVVNEKALPAAGVLKMALTSARIWGSLRPSSMESVGRVFTATTVPPCS